MHRGANGVSFIGSGRGQYRQRAGLILAAGGEIMGSGREKPFFGRIRTKFYPKELQP